MLPGGIYCLSYCLELSLERVLSIIWNNHLSHIFLGIISCLVYYLEVPLERVSVKYLKVSLDRKYLLSGGISRACLAY